MALLEPLARTEAVEKLGGQVLHSGEDDWTRHLLVRDPNGATFTASQFSPVNY